MRDVWHLYVVPQSVRLSRDARWDRFSHAEPLPKNMPAGPAVIVVVHADKRSQDRQEVEDFPAHGALLRRHVLGLGAGYM